MILTSKTAAQTELMRSIRAKTMTIATGPAGTGKTFVSTGIACDLLKDKKYKRLVLARPNISTGRSLGAFPGSADEKLANWLAPLLSNVTSWLGSTNVQSMISKKTLTLQPVETIRGQSYENSLILIDEAQNLTVEEIKSVVTRIGENSKIVLMGDLDQADLRDSGLEWLLNLIKKYQVKDTGVVQFSIDDIVRSDLVGALVRAFAQEKSNKK